MKYTVSLTSISAILCVSSCGSNPDTNDHQNESRLIGDWYGHELFWSKGENSGNGYLGWDYRITDDSIYVIDYPTRIISSHKLQFNGDSIKFTQYEFESCYKWTVKDSILILSGVSYYGNTSQKDSMTFKQCKFESEIISELSLHGFNTKILELGVWKFDEENTKKYRWKEYDTSFYQPPKTLQFKRDQNYFLSLNNVVHGQDTFKIAYMSKDRAVEYYWLELEKIIGQDTIKLSYDMQN
jgi:hypothetical protein